MMSWCSPDQLRQTGDRANEVEIQDCVVSRYQSPTVESSFEYAEEETGRQYHSGGDLACSTKKAKRRVVGRRDGEVYKSDRTTAWAYRAGQPTTLCSNAGGTACRTKKPQSASQCQLGGSGAIWSIGGG